MRRYSSHVGLINSNLKFNSKAQTSWPNVVVAVGGELEMEIYLTIHWNWKVVYC